MEESKKKCEPCSICGVVHEIEKLVEFDGKKLCFECLARGVGKQKPSANPLFGQPLCMHL